VDALSGAMRRSRAEGCLHLRAAGASRQAGFTLVELAVATVVLLVAVLLACDLLTESGRLLHHSVQRAQDPWTLLAAELLRNDIRGSGQPTPLTPDADGWTSEGLYLNGPGGSVAWTMSPRGELVRQLFGGNPHAYVRTVKSFRWRALAGGGVEVWVRLRVSSSYLRQLAGALPQSDAGEVQDLHVLMVARGGGGQQQW
jgi:prepilin-type N-terminal cleavage/methylation domain-containing protein